MDKAGRLAFFALCCFLLISSRRSPKVYRAVVVAVIFSMVFVPLMQDQQAAAFMERQAENQAKQEQTQPPDGDLRQSQAAAADLKAQMTGNWDPHRDPLLEAGNSKLALRLAQGKKLEARILSFQLLEIGRAHV